MKARLKEIPGLEYNFSQPIRDNVNENIAGQFGQIALKIYGDDLASPISRLRYKFVTQDEADYTRHLNGQLKAGTKVVAIQPTNSCNP